MTKSIAFSEYGSVDVLQLQDTPPPEPGPGQVRIAVRASGVNSLDTKIRSGVMRQAFPVTLPHIPGTEAAGVIDALGEGVTGLTTGEPVFGPTLTGSYAQQALLSAELATIIPDPLGFEQAAALTVAAETSYRTLELLALRPGETLLIHAAAGGVGSIGGQIAIARGITVIGTASEANHDYLRSLGVIPVTYGDGLAERVRAVAPGGIDAVLDASGRGVVGVSVELTGDPDRVVTIADNAGAAEYGVRFSGAAPGATRHVPALEEALALFAAGKLKITIQRAYPLEQAAQAQREIEAGHVTGKIVLTV
ncbi:NADP-dependent oxidoreductase [Actinacidiphila acididurans]|uniref:NADP-dependent oxidoreductase n=1 Tax=Actinacidiphila acididurans TaxID=2784346 RepID=A0ABS2TK97_9ACTN|nr:NADP-dependent oxidoreductase [Actinacidiphila acididurans]MBM9503759.1 NADP-dependent oxidoreductase [Actinacidiphila acididurans]